MSLRRIVSLVAVVAAVTSLTGCTVENESSGPAEPTVTIVGNIPRSGLST
jgi:hypothetical protein